MTPTTEFQGFPKIPRLSRDCVVSEKIDGTNAQILIADDGAMLAGSRSRWLRPGKQDNFGFAAWVEANREELARLGPGRHFGEWWGNGIQRGYGLKNGERRFSLFNVSKWEDDAARPACCSVVPVLYRGPFCTVKIAQVAAELAFTGSIAMPGFAKPEGIVVFHAASGVLFKKTLENDEAPKGLK